MSVAAAALTPDAAYLVTDGAYCDPVSGVLRCVSPKTLILPNISAAVTITGDSRLPLFLAAAIYEGGDADFDELKENLGERLRLMFDGSHRELMDQAGVCRDGEILVAGWSPKKNAAASFLFTTGGNYGLAPWVPADSDSYGDQIALPADEDLVENMMQPWQGRINAGNAQRWATELLEWQRKKSWPVWRNGVESEIEWIGIGGFVQLTTITPNAITTRVVHRWPGDKIGDRIGGAEPKRAAA